MKPVIRVVTPAVGALCVIAALAGCGSSAPAKASAPPPKASKHSGTETTVMTTSSRGKDPTYALTASGVFTGSGTFRGIGNGKNSSTAKLAGGSYVVDHPQDKAKKVSESVDQKSCKVKLVEKSPYTIGHGTGKYAGISGSGVALVTETYKVSRLADGKCNGSVSAKPKDGTLHTTIKAVGPVHLP
jgi:hypothetical protein